jgi:hypothetical protein
MKAEPRIAGQVPFLSDEQAAQNARLEDVAAEDTNRWAVPGWRRVLLSVAMCCVPLAFGAFMIGLVSTNSQILQAFADLKYLQALRIWKHVLS